MNGRERFHDLSLTFHIRFQAALKLKQAKEAAKALAEKEAVFFILKFYIDLFDYTIQAEKKLEEERKREKFFKIFLST